MVVQPGRSEDGGSNRRRLVEAGYQVLAERGLDAVTVKELARAAGVSPGLFHYYFASKDELLLAVFQEAGERFKARIAGMPADGRERIAAAVGFIEGMARQEPELFRLRYEIYALGLRRKEFLAALNKLLGDTRDDMAMILSQWFPGVELGRIQAIVAVILACFDGLALQHIAAGQSAGPSASYQLLAEFLENELVP